MIEIIETTVNTNLKKQIIKQIVDQESTLPIKVAHKLADEVIADNGALITQIETLKDNITELRKEIGNFEVDPDDYADAYENSINESHGEIQICGCTFDPAEILKEMDPTAYRCGLNDYVDAMGDPSELTEMEERLDELNGELDELNDELCDEIDGVILAYQEELDADADDEAAIEAADVAADEASDKAAEGASDAEILKHIRAYKIKR